MDTEQYGGASKMKENKWHPANVKHTNNCQKD